MQGPSPGRASRQGVWSAEAPWAVICGHPFLRIKVQNLHGGIIPQSGSPKLNGKRPELQLLSLERTLGTVRSQTPTIHQWGSSWMTNISNVTQRKPGVEGSYVGKRRVCHWTQGVAVGRGSGLCLRLHPMSALCKRVSLYFFPPRERLVAAMLGPSVLQPPQPAIHCAYSVHSLGLLPVVVLSLGGRPRRAGLAGPLPLCPSTVSSPMSTVAWAVWLLKESCLAVCDLRGLRKGQHQKHARAL